MLTVSVLTLATIVVTRDDTRPPIGCAKGTLTLTGSTAFAPVLEEVAKKYDMIHPNATGGKRTAADNFTVRSVFVVGPDRKIKLILTYPMTTGRNFDEVLRVLDSIQLTARHKVSTPVNWRQGEDVIISGSVSDEEAKKQYPDGWKSPRPYIRIVPQPS